MSTVQSDDRGLRFSGPLTLHTLGPIAEQTWQLLSAHPRSSLQADLSELTDLDTAGVVFLRRLPELAREQGRDLSLTFLPVELRDFFDFIGGPVRAPVAGAEPPGHLQRLGEWIERSYQGGVVFLYLMVDLTWAAVAALFRRSDIRRGSFVDQAILIGSQAVSLIGLILFLIGAVSALQAAAQLRQFGADIYVADLLAIGITRELGPLMTAILVSGRSGSAIAAEMATMKFTEELDALRTMALEPLRFVAVPRLWAMLLCVPLLTILADFIGILGGIFIGIISMGIAPTAFVHQVLNSLFLKDILVGLIKSVSFAWIIALIAVYRGLGFRGGAAGVGRATTAAVVSSLFGIIVLDCLWGLLFYLK
jgi:phospholipid/cholesterol/gamma-HCH transport system permease protein